MPSSQPSVFGHVVLVTGPEALLADRAVAELKRRALAEDPETQVTEVDAGLLTGEQLAQMTGASLFSARSLAVIRDLASLDADLADTLAGLVAQPPDDVGLVVQHGGGVKGKALLDKIKKAKPEVIDCPPVKPWELSRFVVAEGRRQGARIDQHAAEALIEGVGNDLRALAAAVTQLLADAAGEPVSDVLVRRYFSGRAEVGSFAVADDTLAGRTGPALEKLRWALQTGVAPVLVTGAFATNLRLLGKYLDVRSHGGSDVAIAQQIGCAPRKVKDLNRLARSWDEPRIARGIQLVALADADIKGAAATADFALERLVISLSRP